VEEEPEMMQAQFQIKQMTVNVPGALLQQLVDAHRAADSNAKDIKIKVLDGSVRVTGKVHHLVELGFDTTWILSTSGNEVAATLDKASVGFLVDALMRRIIFRQASSIALSIFPGAKIGNETITVDVAAIANSVTPGVTFSLSKVECLPDKLVFDMDNVNGQWPLTV
jgi:hypothetical protein